MNSLYFQKPFLINLTFEMFLHLFSFFLSFRLMRFGKRVSHGWKSNQIGFLCVTDFCINSESELEFLIIRIHILTSKDALCEHKHYLWPKSTSMVTVGFVEHQRFDSLFYHICKSIFLLSLHKRCYRLCFWIEFNSKYKGYAYKVYFCFQFSE